MNLHQLQTIMPAAKRALLFLDPLNAAMAEFSINTPARQAMFLAQVGHESGQLNFLKELASGAAYDTGKLAARLGNTPEADGDGQRYKGRGLIQITGTRNYLLCLMALDIDALSHPEILETPEFACRSAAWFWWNNGLNELADKGDFLTITKRINGGTNGLADREALLGRAKKVLT
ncbi:glycoside hydrolase family 19 protein [Herbaspirillum autotrophicum]|uniref:glycoside hydrolase family 19 protein n=1 Tax=Herbaspirillum autotrophicum TaxID=180195 RepID=UPI00067B8114|nr:glycoside hydrolase family 19 protein [Herbaspirillum autotrophicum]